MQIQRLNMDNSWHIRIQGLNLLIDPWLEGEEVDFFPWFNTQWHRTKPIDYDAIPPYDAVLITQKYPDHFHKKTLRQLNPEYIIGPASIQKALRKLLPSAKIIAMDKDQSVHTINGVRVTWLPTRRKIDPIYDAYLIGDEEESIFLAPHGFDIKDGEEPSASVSLLICPFNLYQLPGLLGGTVAPGIEGVIHLASKLQPKQIIATHDEDKHARGLVSRLARIKRTPHEDLLKNSLIADKILDLPDYKPITL